jgi:hypothetical protein
MTTYTVQGPTGKSYTIEGPPGATADQLGATILQNVPEEAKRAQIHAKISAQVDADPISQGAMGFAKDMSGADQFTSAVGKGAHDLIQGAGQRLGDVVNFFSPKPSQTLSTLVTGQAPPTMAARLGLPTSDDVAQSRAIDAPLMATPMGKVGNFVGKVATAIPAAFIPGANGLVGATLIGGAQGVLEPTTADESVLKNAAMGAAGGAAGLGAGKLIGAGARTIKAAAQPFYDAGKQQIVGNALLRAAGSDAPAVMNQLRQAAQPFVGPSQPGLERATMGELVPGSVPMVSQAAGNPGISALSRAAVAVNPEVTNAVTRQAGAQGEARAALLEQLAGKDGARDFAAAERSGTSDQLYGQARANGVDPAALTPEAQANIAQMHARIPAPILASAKELAQINGMPMDDTTSIQGMHYVKQALDDAIASAKSAGNPTKAAALTNLQKDYLTGLDNLSPDYAAARATHAEMSKPVNQMDVAQALLDKSQNPLTKAIQPAAFARALNDKTAAGATGFQGATLENTLTNQQNNLLQSLLEDVRRSNAAETAGRGSGSDTVQKLAYSNMLDQSGVPNFLRQFAPAQILGNVASRGADMAYGRANKELSAQLAQTMLSPEDAAAAMSAATRSNQTNPLLQLLAPYLLSGARSVPPVMLTGQK